MSGRRLDNGSDLAVWLASAPPPPSCKFVSRNYRHLWVEPIHYLAEEI